MKKLLLLFMLSIVVSGLQAQTAKAFKVEVTGKGAPIILIPGYSCSGEVWKETVDHLKDFYECHVLTIAGYAGVPAIDTPVLRSVKNDLIQYVKDQKLEKPILIGHSLGAFMSLWVSSEEPGLFGKIICVDGVPFISALSNPNAHADSLKIDPQFNPDMLVRYFESIPDSGYIDQITSAMLWQVTDTARAKQIAHWNFKGHRKTLALSLLEISTTDLRNDIGRIKQPVLILGSIYQTKENSFKILEDQYKNVQAKTIRVADSKHFIMYDAPVWMYNEIDNFLK